MKGECTQGRCLFSGSMTEDLKIDEILRVLTQAVDPQCPRRYIPVDFSAVERANSVGMWLWAQTLASFQHPVVYVRAPFWLVRHFNIILDLLSRERLVKSFAAPFRDESRTERRFILLTVGKDVPILSDYSAFPLELRDESDKLWLPDFSVPDLLFFLARNFRHFQEIVLEE